MEQLLANAKRNLERGRAIATGIGVFAAVYNKEKKILLIVRKETGSLYGRDLVGKWELPGGGVELSDFNQGYQEAIINCLRREIEEETGLKLGEIQSMVVMLPAWLKKESVIDLAFVIPIPLESCIEMPEYQRLQKLGEAKFFQSNEIPNLDITSPRIRFMVEKAFEYLNQI